MVIVASVALSTMVSNDMLLPWLLRRNNAERPFEVFRHWMLSVRRVSIVVILLLAYVSYRLLGSTASLATIGQIAFAAVTQLAPAMLGALYWKQANRRGVFAGLAAGTFLWFYTLVLPIAAHSLGWSLSSSRGWRGCTATRCTCRSPTDPGRGAVPGGQLHPVRLGLGAVAHTGLGTLAGRALHRPGNQRPPQRTLDAGGADRRPAATGGTLCR
jgi:hypothetical protein